MNKWKKSIKFFFVFLYSNCTPFMSQSFHIWDHIFPTFFPKDSENLKSLDIGLWEVGAKRQVNRVRKCDRQTEKTNKQTYGYFDLYKESAQGADSLKIELARYKNVSIALWIYSIYIPDTMHIIQWICGFCFQGQNLGLGKRSQEYWEQISGHLYLMTYNIGFEREKEIGNKKNRSKRTKTISRVGTIFEPI